MNLETIDTPSLVIELSKMQRNIDRMKAKAHALGVTLRPHLKTSKCWEVARRQMLTPLGPATVSTLKEAEEFAAHGVKDMIYAVGIAPQKLPRVHALLRQGVDLKIILDNVAAAHAVTTYCAMWKPYILAFILFYKEELRNSKRGAAIPHLNKELFYNLPIGIPPYQEQQRIAKRINELSQLLK